ncbi:hypothetical protein [Methanobrevibacter sp.]
MKNSSRIVLGFMLVMMICCVSAVSATDINSTDDTLITDEIAVDDVSEIVEDVEIDDASDDVVEANDNAIRLRSIPSDLPQVNSVSYTAYFDSNGVLTNNIPAYNLVFTGSFNNTGIGFDKLTINRQANLDLTGATFNNVGFNIINENVKLNGGTFNSDGTTGNGAVINVNGATNAEINDVHMNLYAPNTTDYIAIDVNNSENAKIINNTITYTCNNSNPTNFNYVIRAKNSKNMYINYNTINATLPLKQVNWALSGSIDADYVAGVAIENCTNVKFKYNTLDVIGHIRSGDYPTLDAFIIALSPNAEIEHNKINEDDVVTVENQYSYIYGIDVYSCNNTHINNNTVNMNGGQSGGLLPSGEGTGAAYCIQLSGNHSNVIISNNKLTTKNQGPNLGIYSQNANATSNLKIQNNIINVTGKAGEGPWSLVSGIEVQDTSAEICDNVITVNNTAGYFDEVYAFGISYAQWLDLNHYYNIHNNNVTVINGRYAVYLLDDVEVSGTVNNNKLIANTGATNYTGNNAVSVGNMVINVDNY